VSGPTKFVLREWHGSITIRAHKMVNMATTVT